MLLSYEGVDIGEFIEYLIRLSQYVYEEESLDLGSKLERLLIGSNEMREGILNK